MEDIKKWIEGNKKTPKFVKVYDKLYKMICDGEFDADDKLPSEPVLAEIMGVSRMTLRQAIGLLQDDGIIQKIQGKGNFLLKNSRRLKRGLQLLQHPVHSSLEVEIDEVEIEFSVQLPNDYARRMLGPLDEAVLFVDRWYKSEGFNVAYTLTMLPTEVLKENSINLSNKKELLKFLEKKVYTKPNTSKLKFNYTETVKFVSSRHANVKEKRTFLLEEEIVLSKTSRIIHNKHYIPLHNSDIIIERK